MRPHLPLIAILTVAFALRVWGIGFGLPHTLARPDEEAVMAIALRFFRRTLNPEFFHWPSLFMYAVAIGFVVLFNVGRWVGWFRSEMSFVRAASQDPSAYYLVARALSALAGVLTVWASYRVALQLFDRTTGLVAAAFLAVAALHAREAHFGLSDVAATALLTLSFAQTVRFARSGATRDAIGSAIWAGLAASTKYNAGLIALPGIYAVLTSTEGVVRAWSSRLRLAGVYGALAAAMFVVGTPYALLDWPAFLTGLQEITEHLRNGHMIHEGPAWTIHVTSSLHYGVGYPLLAAGVAGLVMCGVRQPRSGILLALFPVTYFVVVGAGQTAFARYVVPVIPFLCIAGAHCVVDITRCITARAERPSLAPALAWSLAALVAAPSIVTIVRLDLLLTREDSRLLAADWIEENFTGSVALYQSGMPYGQVQMRTADPIGFARFRDVIFDETADRFRFADDKSDSRRPDLIVLQESPLGYSAISDRIRAIVAAEYELATTFAAMNLTDSRLVFDRDDAFFVPLAGFGAMIRPGPNMTIYRRRATDP